MTENNENGWKIARYKLELGIIESLLSDPDYLMSGSDFDYETNITDLAMQAQQDRNQLRAKVSSLEAENIRLQEEISQLKGNKYKEKTYQYVYEEKLNPPAYQPTDDEISLAKARYAFENEIWEVVYYLKMYIDCLEGKEMRHPYTKENVEKYAKDAWKDWDEALSKWTDDNEIWDCLVSPEWFKAAYVDSLSDFHGGDCTAFPASCPRCHAEGMFKIPYTANWGKSEGYKMEQAFLKDLKEKKTLKEQANVPGDKPGENN